MVFLSFTLINFDHPHYGCFRYIEQVIEVDVEIVGSPLKRLSVRVNHESFFVL